VAQRKGVLSDLKPFLLELVQEGLRRCLKREADSGGLVGQFAQEALQKALDRVHLRFHLNPQDVKELESRRGELAALSGSRELEIVADPRVERGGVLLETEAGSVDARIGTVVDRLKGALDVRPGVPELKEGTT
jgi:flagellar biosynthesis/type III secretory pathway protein FliH